MVLLRLHSLTHPFPKGKKIILWRTKLDKKVERNLANNPINKQSLLRYFARIKFAILKLFFWQIQCYNQFKMLKEPETARCISQEFSMRYNTRGFFWNVWKCYWKIKYPFPWSFKQEELSITLVINHTTSRLLRFFNGKKRFRNLLVDA